MKSARFLTVAMLAAIVLPLHFFSCSDDPTGPDATAPAINTQPVSQSVVVGDNATFSVSATGTAPLSYQWRKDGTAIPGATSETYSITSVSNADTGDYDVIVGNSAGSDTSDAATLTVSAVAIAPAITTHPSSQSISVGQTATFTVVATGTSPLAYQWQKGTAIIPGATSASYTTPAATLADNATTYRCIVSNGAGRDTSNAATLTATATATPPTVTTHPSDQSVSVGQTAAFSVVATGSAPLAYQWQKGTANIPGATSAGYTNPATTLADNATTYRCVVSNGAGSDTSDAATLTVFSGATTRVQIRNSLQNCSIRGDSIENVEMYGVRVGSVSYGNIMSGQTSSMLEVVPSGSSVILRFDSIYVNKLDCVPICIPGTWIYDCVDSLAVTVQTSITNTIEFTAAATVTSQLWDKLHVCP